MCTLEVAYSGIPPPDITLCVHWKWHTAESLLRTLRYVYIGSGIQRNPSSRHYAMCTLEVAYSGIPPTGITLCVHWKWHTAESLLRTLRYVYIGSGIQRNPSSGHYAMCTLEVAYSGIPPPDITLCVHWKWHTAESLLRALRYVYIGSGIQRNPASGHYAMCTLEVAYSGIPPPDITLCVHWKWHTAESRLQTLLYVYIRSGIQRNPSSGHYAMCTLEVAYSGIPPPDITLCVHWKWHTLEVAYSGIPPPDIMLCVHWKWHTAESLLRTLRYVYIGSGIHWKWHTAESRLRTLRYVYIGSGIQRNPASGHYAMCTLEVAYSGIPPPDIMLCVHWKWHTAESRLRTLRYVYIGSGIQRNPASRHYAMCTLEVAYSGIPPPDITLCVHWKWHTAESRLRTLRYVYIGSGIQRNPASRHYAMCTLEVAYSGIPPPDITLCVHWKWHTAESRLRTLRYVYIGSGIQRNPASRHYAMCTLEVAYSGIPPPDITLCVHWKWHTAESLLRTLLYVYIGSGIQRNPSSGHYAMCTLEVAYSGIPPPDITLCVHWKCHTAESLLRTLRYVYIGSGIQRNPSSGHYSMCTLEVAYSVIPPPDIMLCVHWKWHTAESLLRTLLYVYIGSGIQQNPSSGHYSICTLEVAYSGIPPPDITLCVHWKWHTAESLLRTLLYVYIGSGIQRNPSYGHYAMCTLEVAYSGIPPPDITLCVHWKWHTAESLLRTLRYVYIGSGIQRNPSSGHYSMCTLEVAYSGIPPPGITLCVHWKWHTAESLLRTLHYVYISAMPPLRICGYTPDVHP